MLPERGMLWIYPARDPSPQKHKQNVYEGKSRHWAPSCSVPLARDPCKLLGHGPRKCWLGGIDGSFLVAGAGESGCFGVSFLSPAALVAELNTGQLCPAWKHRCTKRKPTVIAGMGVPSLFGASFFCCWYITMPWSVYGSSIYEYKAGFLPWCVYNVVEMRTIWRKADPTQVMPW